MLPEEQLQQRLSPILEGEFRSWQLRHRYRSSLRSLIRQPQLRNLPVLIATPTQYHIPYAEVILEEGHFVAIEKPIAASFRDISRFEKLLAKHGADKMFLFACYLLEKGLPLAIWAWEGHVDAFVADLVTFESTLPTWQEARRALGEVREIYGVILEAIGPAGQLNQRRWVLDPVNGGNTVETFYHLVCLVSVVLGCECPISIRDVRLARHSEIPGGLLQEDSNSDIAETLTWAIMDAGAGTRIELLAAKYVPSRLHQRWVVIKCEHGLARMNLETQRLEIRTENDLVSSTLRWPQKYTTHFMLLTEKLYRPNLPIEEALMRHALVQTLNIREVGLNRGIAWYRDEDVEPEYISDGLAAYLV